MSCQLLKKKKRTLSVKSEGRKNWKFATTLEAKNTSQLFHPQWNIHYQFWQLLKCEDVFLFFFFYHVNLDCYVSEQMIRSFSDKNN